MFTIALNQKNVFDELEAVKMTLSTAISHNHKNSTIKQFVSEIGNSTLTEWYNETQSPIAVNDEISFTCTSGFDIKCKLECICNRDSSRRALQSTHKNHSVKLFQPISETILAHAPLNQI